MEIRKIETNGWSKRQSKGGMPRNCIQPIREQIINSQRVYVWNPLQKRVFMKAMASNYKAMTKLREVLEVMKTE